MAIRSSSHKECPTGSWFNGNGGESETFISIYEEDISNRVENCGRQRTFEVDACALARYVKEEQKSNSGDWECQCWTWSDCQQTQSIDNYIHTEDMIAGLQCKKPSLQRWMHYWEFSGVKIIDKGLQRHGRKWCVQISNSSYSILQYIHRYERYIQCIFHTSSHSPKTYRIITDSKLPVWMRMVACLDVPSDEQVESTFITKNPVFTTHNWLMEAARDHVTHVSVGRVSWLHLFPLKSHTF